MRILLFADVHHRPAVNRLRQKMTLYGLQKCIDNIPCDLIVFLGDIVHGTDFANDRALYEKYLRAVLDKTKNIPFATVFGNHDDECGLSKKEILGFIGKYPNALTKGQNYVLQMQGETLLFLDSGTYYDGPEGGYDIVRPEVTAWAKDAIQGTKAILFQHIIVPDIRALTDGKRFKKGVSYTGKIGETPCPPKVMTSELTELAPHLKAAVFGHDHQNSFETVLKGVKLIQCSGAGWECYEYPRRPHAKLLDTATLETKVIRL